MCISTYIVNTAVCIYIYIYKWFISFVVRVDSTGLQSRGCVFLSRLAHRSPLWSWKQLKDLPANSLAVRFLTFYVYTEIRTFVVKLRINNPTELCFKPFHILWCVFGHIYIYIIIYHIFSYYNISLYMSHMSYHTSVLLSNPERNPKKCMKN